MSLVRRLTLFTVVSLVIGAGLLVAFGIAHARSQARHNRAMWLAEIVPAYHGRYTASDVYLGPGGTLTPADETLGTNGLPLITYPGLGPQVNPLSIAFYGLSAYSHRDRNVTVRAADWLVANQHRGAWLYLFPFNAERPPWTSAITQGVAMSLLERAYRATGNRAYLAAGLRALDRLDKPPLRGNLNGGLFFQEYPVSQSHVLNGFIYTLIGLHDLASVAPGSRALALYTAGRQTLIENLRLWDVNGKPAYDLAARKVAPSYVPTVVFLLHALNSISPSTALERYEAEWEAAI